MADPPRYRADRLIAQKKTPGLRRPGVFVYGEIKTLLAL